MTPKSPPKGGGTKNIFNYFLLIIFLLNVFINKRIGVNGQHDFQFENGPDEDLQVVFTEPIVNIETSSPHTLSTKIIIPLKTQYEKEVEDCPYSENKVILSLVMRSHSWNDIVNIKQQKAINKLSKFFAIPKEYFELDDITKHDVYEMTKFATHHGSNHLNEKHKRLGKIEFIIGCGKTLFPNGQLIANQISQQIKYGTIDDITGLDFGWWSIWTKRVNNRVPRSKRQAPPEGSGEDDYEDYYDNEEDEEGITEVPTVSTHGHRHHHGENSSSKPVRIPEPPMPTTASTTPVTTTSTTTTTTTRKPPTETTTIKISKEKVTELLTSRSESPSLSKIVTTTTEIPITTPNSIVPTTMINLVDVILKTELETPYEEYDDDDDDADLDDNINETKINSNKQTADNDDNDDIRDSLSKLELDITKTIENNDKLKDTDDEIEKILYKQDAKQHLSKKVSDDDIAEEKLKHINVDDDYVIEDINTQMRNKMDDNLIKTNSNKLNWRDNKINIGKLPPITSTVASATIITTTIISDVDERTTTESLIPTTTYINFFNSNTNNNDIVTEIDLTNFNNKNLNVQTTTSTTPPTPIEKYDNDDVPIVVPEITTTERPIVITTSTTPAAATITTTQVTTSEIEKNIVTEQAKKSGAVLATTEQTFVQTTTEELPSPAVTKIPQSGGRYITTTPVPGVYIDKTGTVESDDEDDDYDDVFEQTTMQQAMETTTLSTTTTERVVPIIQQSTTTNVTAATPEAAITTTTTEKITTTTEYIEAEPMNTPPMIKNRLPKQPLTAGKPFSLVVPLETFYDNEDGTNLKLELFDKNENQLKANSWIQLNPETREIYGLPLEDAVSRWQYKLRATDMDGESVTEILDISVQQHKAHRSANHEISIGIKLNEKFKNNVDWQIRLIRGIVETLGDNVMSNVVVREIRHSSQDPNIATFVYTNETLPKDKCPEDKLDTLVKRLNIKDLSESLAPEIIVKTVSGQPIGPCQKASVVKPKPTPHIAKNFPPVPRNQVDRVNATVGQLLVFKVPADTFYDPEDGVDLKLSLLSQDRTRLDPKHWLQFDSKNQEFFGIPKNGDAGQKEYLLVAEDREGLTATDALVVIVNHAPKRDYSALFEMTLGIPYESFNSSTMQRRFIERITQIFGDQTTSNIQIRSIRHIHHTGHTLVSFYNTTLYKVDQICPDDEIEVLRNVLMHQDSSLRHKARDTLGNEFNLLKVNILPVGSCQGGDTIHHEVTHIKTDDTPPPTFKDDYLLTFVLPAVIILAMLLLASIIACVLHRRRLTGKMELGDEEERRSFRSKGIPVIFQDELDEKPEIGNKSPVILKDEKPPLLPPSYTGTNPDGENEDLDEYVPPPAVVMGGRESRGKSPVTPSYRKPPPYVSP